jgi:hypothetical protein
MPLVKPIVRLVLTSQRKPLVVRFSPEGVWVKEPGQRWSSALLCPWGVVHVRAAWLAAEARKRERAEARKAKRALKNGGL